MSEFIENIGTKIYINGIAVLDGTNQEDVWGLVEKVGNKASESERYYKKGKELKDETEALRQTIADMQDQNQALIASGIESDNALEIVNEQLADLKSENKALTFAAVTAIDALFELDTQSATQILKGITNYPETPKVSRHNSDDEIATVLEDSTAQCDVCGEYKPVLDVGLAFADDDGIILACKECRENDKPLTQNFDDESNMPH